MQDKVQEPTIYAAYRHPAEAEAATTRLVDRGVRADQISLIVSETHKGDPVPSAEHVQSSYQGEATHPSGQDIPAHTPDPTEREINFGESTVFVTDGGAFGAPDPLGVKMHNTPLPENAVSTPKEIEDDLNPAQNDYPMTSAGSSAPPAAARDFNAGIENDHYNADYQGDVQLENEAQVEHTNAVKEAAKERAEDKGVETHTIGDAADTVKKSAILGVGVGTLAAIATLAIPGYGLILGGGALAAAVATMAKGADSGEVAGGVANYLSEQGIPAADIPAYRKAVEEGGAILAVHPETEADRADLEAVLRSSGAVKTSSYGYAS
jgi:hypothetical protein